MRCRSVNASRALDMLVLKTSMTFNEVVCKNLFFWEVLQTVRVAPLQTVACLRVQLSQLCRRSAADRKSGLMSASVFDPCGRISLVRGLLLLTCTLLLTEGRLLNCSHPLVPEHGGFRCEPSPCRGFPHRSSIRFFCETGYHISRRKPFSSCRHGRWDPPMPTCIPVKGSPPRSETPANDSMPSMATTAVGVSIFLLTTTACLVVKSRLYPCQSRGRRSSDQLDLMVDGLPVSLPSYEEAVYGSWGQRIPACSSPGPTQLLLSQESASLQPLLHSPDNPPPPYEEVPSSRPRDADARQLHVPPVKDT